MSGRRFEVSFIDETAAKEYRALDGSTRRMVDNGLARLSQRADEIGKPLRGELAGCKELKFRTNGLRVIFRIINGMVEIVEIVAIGRRAGDKVFADAARRISRNESS